MIRVSPYLLLVSGLVFGLAACSSDEEHHRMHGGAQRAPRCEAQTTCGTCTPILGCGWCQYEDGTGSCATGPSACRELSFRWNWEPTDCPVPPSDAGLTPADAAPAVDSGTTSDSADSGTTTDSADSGTTTDSADSGTTTDSADSGTTTDSGTATSADTSCLIPAAASAVCAPTTGGTLCPSDRYTLGCHATGGAVPTPDTALGCIKAYSAGAETYYCCPCGG